MLPSSLGVFDASHGLIGSGAYPCAEHWLSVVSITQCQAGAILYTADGGRTTQVVMRTHGPVSSIAIVGSQAWAFAFRCPHALGLCAQGALLHSTNRGRTWKPISDLPLFDVSFADQSHGFGVLLPNACDPDCSPFPSLAATADGGKTWQRIDTPCGHDTSRPQVFGVSLVSRSLAWLLCVGRENERQAGSMIHLSAEKAVYRTDDSGRTWKQVVSVPVTGSAMNGLPPRGEPTGIAFSPTGVGAMWEVLGSQYLTRDGGRHWRALEPPEKEDGVAGALGAGRIELVLYPARAPVDRVRLAKTGLAGGGLVTVRTWRF